MLAFLIGRLIFGGFLLFNALNHFTSHGMMAQFAAAKGVPAPDVAVLVSGFLLLLGGISLVLGWQPTWGVIATVLFLVPVTLFMHNFWDESGAERTADMINFTKNIAMVGAALMFVAIPRPWPYSVEATTSRQIRA